MNVSSSFDVESEVVLFDRLEGDGVLVVDAALEMRCAVFSAFLLEYISRKKLICVFVENAKVAVSLCHFSLPYVILVEYVE